MISNGGRAAGFGKRKFYMVTVLLAALFVLLLFAAPALAQEKQKEPVSEAQKIRIERFSDALLLLLLLELLEDDNGDNGNGNSGDNGDGRR